MSHPVNTQIMESLYEDLTDQEREMYSISPYKVMDFLADELSYDEMLRNLKEHLEDFRIWYEHRMDKAEDTYKEMKEQYHKVRGE